MNGSLFFSHTYWYNPDLHFPALPYPLVPRDSHPHAARAFCDSRLWFNGPPWPHISTHLNEWHHRPGWWLSAILFSWFLISSTPTYLNLLYHRSQHFDSIINRIALCQGLKIWTVPLWPPTFHIFILPCHSHWTCHLLPSYPMVHPNQLTRHQS